MNRKEIITAEDREQFLEAVQDLHDSCIVQVVYTPSTYVEENGAMPPCGTIQADTTSGIPSARLMSFC